LNRTFPLLLILGLAACGGDDATSPSDLPPLVVLDLEVGTGPAAQVGDSVAVHYVGRLSDGTQFDSSYDSPTGEPLRFVIGAGRVISGFEQGVEGMRVGGRRRLTIPPHLGYGNQQVGSIPPNSTLSFDVELVEIVGE
jgi:FKBP-type peptidyl-prolyl cis-trans isomerase